MIQNAAEYLDKKFELAHKCLQKTVECNKQFQGSLNGKLTIESIDILRKKKDEIREIWAPLTEFQKSYPKEPNYYLKRGTHYARVFFTPMWEDVNYIITDDTIPAKFIKHQINKDPWSIIINREFIAKYTLLHLFWFISILKFDNLKSSLEKEEELYIDIEFPDFIPKCQHCGRHFTKLAPNQKYCSSCQNSVKELGFNPLLDKESHKFCLNCGKHLPNNKHKKAKFCLGACRTAYWRKKRSNNL